MIKKGLLLTSLISIAIFAWGQAAQLPPSLKSEVKLARGNPEPGQLQGNRHELLVIATMEGPPEKKPRVYTAPATGKPPQTPPAGSPPRPGAPGVVGAEGEREPPSTPGTPPGPRPQPDRPR